MAVTASQHDINLPNCLACFPLYANRLIHLLWRGDSLSWLKETHPCLRFPFSVSCVFKVDLIQNISSLYLVCYFLLSRHFAVHYCLRDILCLLLNSIYSQNQLHCLYYCMIIIKWLTTWNGIRPAANCRFYCQLICRWFSLFFKLLLLLCYLYIFFYILLELTRENINV